MKQAKPRFPNFIPFLSVFILALTIAACGKAEETSVVRKTDATRPVITAGPSTAVTTSGATITWTTNEASTSQVKYSTDLTYSLQTTLDSNLATSHSQTISGLNAGVTYNFKVYSADASSNLLTSGSFTFTTSAGGGGDITPPVISSVTASGVTSTDVTITWTTDENADSLVEYGTTTAYGSTTTVDRNFVTSHSQNITGLTAGTQYNYRVYSEDASLNSAVSANYTFTTSGGGGGGFGGGGGATPLVISNVSSGTVTANSATITWVTNNTADSQVEYGTTTAYGSTTTLDTNLVVNHGVIVTGLTGLTQYNYRVLSADASANLVTSSNYTFTTLSASGDTTPPVISGISSGTPTSTSVTITWTTDEAADSQVEYGTTTSYGTTTTLDTNLVTSHSQIITGLTALTQYNYRVLSADASTNSASSANNTFTTASPSGSVNFTWTAPTTNSDGAAIYDLAGYKLYYSATSGNYAGAAVVDVKGANTSSYLESTLGAGTWYAVIKAYDTSGNLSAASNEVTFTL